MKLKLVWYPINIRKRVRHPLDKFIEHLKMQDSPSTMSHAIRIGFIQIGFGWKPKEFNKYNSCEETVLN